MALSDWRGAANEEDVPYPVTVNLNTGEREERYTTPPAEAEHIQRATFQDASLWGNSVEDIKKAVYTNHAAAASYCMETRDYYNYDTGAYSCPIDNTTNHVITIVGWNDYYSKDNFLPVSNVKSDGAWIAKNSWGSDWGDEGYFYISYEDQSLEDVLTLNMVEENPYDYNYHYDGTVSNHRIRVQNEYGIGNVYQVKGKESSSEVLEAVSFPIYTSDCRVEIRVYKNIREGGNPEEGKLAATEIAYVERPGIHTFVLDTPVIMKKGEYFSVVLTNKSNKYVEIGVENNANTSTEGRPTVPELKEGRSYQNYYGTWQTMSRTGGYELRIHAYTKNFDGGAKKLTLNKGTLSLKTGNKAVLKAILEPDYGINTILWSSSNDKVVTVNQYGTVQAKKVGQAIITATSDNGLEAVCKVEVSNVSPKKITLNKNKQTLYKGKTYTLNASITPKNAAKSVVWTSSNKKVATVDDNGKVRGIKKGTAVITVKTFNGKTAACKFTVKEIPAKTIKLNRSTLLVNKGDTYQLKAVLTPKNSTDTIKWTSSDSNVARVTSGGKITAKNTGTVTITASLPNKKKAVCKVTVVSPAQELTISPTVLRLSVGDTFRMKVILEPASSDDPCTWKSSNPAVATVDSSGLVTAKKSGETTLTATTRSGLKKSSQVTVYQKLTGIYFSQSEFTMEPGTYQTMDVEMEPLGAYEHISYSSSHKYVAEISEDGFLCARGAGTAIITAKSESGFTATCKVIVRRAVSRIYFPQSRVSMVEGEGQQLMLRYEPSGVDRPEIRFSSDNTAVATVDGQGYVYGIAPGSAVITATTVGSVLKATCQVDIKPKSLTAINLSTSKRAASDYYGEVIPIEKIGETFYMDVDTSPYQVDRSELDWSSSNNSIASVGWDGKITIKNTGAVTIKAKVGECEAKYRMHILFKGIIFANKQTVYMSPGESTRIQFRTPGVPDSDILSVPNLDRDFFILKSGNINFKLAGYSTVGEDTANKRRTDMVILNVEAIGKGWAEILYIGHEDIAYFEPVHVYVD